MSRPTELPDSWIYALRNEMRTIERPTDAQRQIAAYCTMAIDGNDAERREATERLVHYASKEL